MLGIQRDQVTDHRVDLILEGCIVETSAELLARECLELGRFGFRVVLDLQSVIFIDRFGVKLLGRLVSTGVRIVGCAPLFAAMLADEGIPVNGKTR